MNQDSIYQSASSRRTFIRNSAGATLGLFAAGSALAACGGSSAPSGPITVTIMNMPSKASSPNDYANWNTAAHAWSKKHAPYKIVGVEGGFDPTSFYPKFAAGTAPDVIQTFFTEPSYMIEKHIATDITNLFKTSSYADIFSTTALAIVSDAGGHIYGLPYGAYRLALMYNRTLFQQAGLDPDKPPLSWDDLESYAQRIAQKTGKAGFVECAAGNQGGWHFLNWLYTAGGRAETTKNGTTTATFNDANGLAVLQLLQKMRWSDNSMSAQQANFQQNNTADLVATGQAAMCVQTLGTPGNYYKGKGSIDFLGLGPMPQKDGKNHGVLAGGNVWVFNAKSKPEVIKGGFEYEAYETYDLGMYEQTLKAQAADNKVVGLPETAIFGGNYLKQMLNINAKYVNVPTQNYKSYIDSALPIVPEPRLQVQDMYALLDPVVQAVFTQQNANLQQLLNDAASTFQTRYLDTAGS